ncbi:hypothetical protein GCM10023328_41220 [Modestobacter marinus]|uniref:Uncharacterized protein n=1 Tax=Modestobacter marinus TaxID=477641 RepID=A0A846LLU2_9ACTN|nr:hypothetical protein [Modestobacter marinus]NIH68576.1 hypothetical protein [Modestobacter marinus]GGL58354.1 hypothetical protein GCM10011589_12970 [Modestobacter marinus]
MLSRQRRRLGVIGTITGAVVAGVLAPPAAAHPGRPADATNAVQPDWFDYDRPAAYDTVVERLQVPMRDGFELGCTIARPAVGGEPAAGSSPGSSAATRRTAGPWRRPRARSPPSSANVATT